MIGESGGCAIQEQPVVQTPNQYTAQDHVQAQAGQSVSYQLQYAVRGCAHQIVHLDASVQNGRHDHQPYGALHPSQAPSLQWAGHAQMTSHPPGQTYIYSQTYSQLLSTQPQTDSVSLLPTPGLSQSPYSPASTMAMTPNDPSGTNSNPYFPPVSSATSPPQEEAAPVLAEKPDKQSVSLSAKEAERPLSTASSAPPPAYSANEQQLREDPNVANLSSSLAGLKLRLPTDVPEPIPDQCLAHLKLLECFYVLRDKVSKTDGLFGIPDSLAKAEQSSTENQTSDADLLREKRWAVYVSRAVDRFESWWTRCAPSTRHGQPWQKLKMADLDGSAGKAFEASFEHKFQVPFTVERLPPLGMFVVSLVVLFHQTSRELTVNTRCCDGLAFIHAQSSCFCRRLSSPW
jgi:hypothetical protein